MDAPQASPTVKAAPQNISASIVDGKEFFQVGNQPPPPRAAAAAPAEAPQTPAPVMLEEDDLNTTVSPGTVCRRKGCGTIFVSNEVNRQGDGEGTVCHYHPLPVSILRLWRPLCYTLLNKSRRSLEKAAR